MSVAMMNKGFGRRTLLATAISLVSVVVFASALPELKPEQGQMQSDKLVQSVLRQSHYARPRINDELSVKIYEAYLKTLDPSRSVFLKADVDGFEIYRNQIDDAILRADLSIAYSIYSLYLQRINERYDYVSSLLQKPMSFEAKERFDYDRENASWPKTAAEANEIWRQRIKNEALSLQLANKKWEEIRDTIAKRYDAFKRRVTQVNNEDVFSSFMNAFTTSIDPHTNYLSPEQAQNFDIDMSLKLRGIGAVLQADDVYVKVSSIVPASPADKSKQIFTDDRIVAVAQGDGPLVDVVGWRLDDVVKLVRGEVGTTVRLEVLPRSEVVGGKTKIISIVRDEIKLDEQRAKSDVIKLNDHGRSYQIGVIDVPKFYVDFEAKRQGQENYNSSARDVRNLLEKLKAQNVDAIVLDLRDNGGGGLDESVDMAGLFIDKGPIVQERDPMGRIEVGKDTDDGAVWKGPLAVLVNGQSASASEIAAAALQDYGRAVVIGEPTFGKGTVQQVMDLNYWADRSGAELGSLKYTVRKFYRITGGSTQHRGVVPDINLPQLYDQSEFGESALPNALPWDYVPATKYTPAGNVQKFVTQLKGLQESRIAKDDEFQYLVQDIASYKALKAEKSISLNEAERRAERDRDQARDLQRENARRAKKNLPPLKALPDAPDAEKLPDVRLNEAAHIAADLAWLQVAAPTRVVDAGNEKKLTKLQN